MMKSMTRSIASAFAMAALCAFGSTACSQDEEEGRWIELPGGRMVYGTPGELKDTERLIYRIDNDRYFTMMTTKDDAHCAQDGVAWYYDTKRRIKSEVGPTSIRNEPIFAMDPQQYLAMPDPSGSLQSNARLYFSTDYGRSWQDIRFIGQRAGLVVKDDVLVYLEGQRYGESVELNGAKVWSFSRLVREKDQPGETTPGGDYYDHIENVWTLRFGASKDDAPDVKIDIDAFTKVAPPSGWRHLRCDPMPTKPAQP